MNPPSNLHILMVCPQFHPIVGGYEKSAERLSKELVLLGQCVTVVTERRQPNWPRKQLLNGVSIRRHWCIYRRRIHLITSLASLATFLITRGRKFDIWHIHQYGAHAVVAIIISKIFKKPTVLKLTSSKDQGLKGATQSLIFPKISERVIKTVSAVAALTRETEIEALEFGIPAEKVHILRNGIDSSKFHPPSEQEKSDLLKKKGINSKGIILFVGRISEEKNPLGLLNAWSKINSSYRTDWRLVIVGSGPQDNQLKAYIRNNDLEGTVLLTGRQEDTHHWYSIADIYIVSSHREGLSNTMIEAMSTGLPTISTAVSGAKEVLEETGSGLVVDTALNETLDCAITSLINDKQLRESIGKIARHTAVKEFSIQNVAQSYRELYIELLSEHKREVKV